jgi:Flp pilus assembly pilin Flp
MDDPHTGDASAPHFTDDVRTIPTALPSASIPPWRSAPMQKLYNWLTREDGQTMAEYGVVLAVITIAVFGALALLSGNIVNAMTRVAGYIT